MYIDKIIKREFWVLVVSVITLLILIIGISYSLFFQIDEDDTKIIKTGDLNISFCNDNTCNTKYENFGQIIGLSYENGKVKPNAIYPYMQVSEALATNPYVFNVKNTGTLDAYLKIRLNEDKNVEINEEYSEYVNANEEYKNHLKVAISNCTKKIDRENVSVLSYSSLSDNIILDNKLIDVGQDITFCIWTFLDETTPNSVQNSYFVANIDIEAIYKPKK